MYQLAIVDDNEAWCFALALQLEQQGYAVSTFTDVSTFLRRVAQFDVVLVDFSMPTPRYQRRMDGPEVIYQVKQQVDNPPLLVLVSSFFTLDLLKDAASICPEADAVFSKQIETAKLLNQIQQLLSRRTPRNRQQNGSNAAASSTQAEILIQA